VIDLTSKTWCCFGTRGSGKSWLVKHILDSTPEHLIYDPLGEHKGYRRYVPEDRASLAELEEFVKAAIIPDSRAPTRGGPLSLFVVDEANKYIRPKPSPLPAGIDDLNDFSRHWGLSVGFVCRRPVQFHTDIVELSNYVFFFGLAGKNDYRYMEVLHQGLGDAVRNLRRFEFISLADGKEITLHAPIDSPKYPVQT